MREEELEPQNPLLSYWQPTELESKNPLPSCTLVEKHSWVAPIKEGLAEPLYHIGARPFSVNWGMCVKSFIRL